MNFTDDANERSFSEAQPRTDDCNGSAGALARLTELIVQLGPDTLAADVVRILTESVLALEMDAAVFIARLPTAGSPTCRVLLASDPGWLSTYEASGCYRDDPWLAYARDQVEPIEAGRLPSANELQAAIAPFGFSSTLVVPAPSSRRRTPCGALCLGSRSPGRLDERAARIQSIVAQPLAMTLLQWCIAEARDELRRSSGVTKQDLRLLEHEWRGHSTKHIARLEGTSPCAVDSRFQRINLKLGVRSKTHAAQLVADHGLI